MGSSLTSKSPHVDVTDEVDDITVVAIARRVRSTSLLVRGPYIGGLCRKD
jgi:hypothetical protein